MLTLAIDTAAGACQACILDGETDRVLARASELLGRGHAERLMSQIDEVLAGAEIDLHDIARIAVAVGPGSFTGIRVGVAVARGLALALGCDSVGITCLEAIGTPAAIAAHRPVLAVIDARRGAVHAQLFGADGGKSGDAAVMAPGDAAACAAANGAALAGSGAGLVAQACLTGREPMVLAGNAEPIDIAVVARLAAGRNPPFERPVPLYLRGADAKPQTGFAVARRA